MRNTKIYPASLGPAVGYAHGVKAGNLLFVAGQIGGTPKGKGQWEVVSGGFAPQMEKALENVAEVVREAGGRVQDIVEMTIYVKDMESYRTSRKALAPVWQRVMGRHYPAITMVEVSDLFEKGSLLEIRAVAALG